MKLDGIFGYLSPRRHFCAPLVALAFVLAGHSRAFANGMALSDVIFDWSGLSYTIGGGLLIDHIDPAGSQAESAANTLQGGTSIDAKQSVFDPQGWGKTSAASLYATNLGSAASHATTDFGHFTGSSQAATSSHLSNRNTALSDASTGIDFFLYGSGVGDLTVTIPYTMSVACQTDNPINQFGNGDIVAAMASVGIAIGPGTGPGTSATLSCQDATGFKSGTLSVSMTFTNPTFGPLVDIEAFARTSVTASTVPEPTFLSACVMGLLGLSVIVLFRRGRFA